MTHKFAAKPDLNPGGLQTFLDKNTEVSLCYLKFCFILSQFVCINCKLL